MLVKSFLVVSLSILNIQVHAIVLPPQFETRGDLVITGTEADAALRYGWDPITQSMVLSKLDPTISLPPPKRRDLVVHNETEDPNELSTRDTPAWLQMGVKGVIATANHGGTLVLTWMGLAYSCQDFSEKPEDRFQCVMAAITTAIIYATKARQLQQWFGSLSQHGRDNGWGVGFIGAQRTRGLHSRDLDRLSDIIGSTVHYAGEYLESAPEGATLAQREEIQSRSVFGFTNPGGIDMHLAIRDGEDSESVSIKLGLGNGFGDKNGQKAKRAGYETSHFSSGGINIIAQSGDERQVDPVNDWHHFLNMVTCAFSSPNDGTWSDIGLYFQVYDIIQQNTLIGGALAPFSGDNQVSEINYLVNIPHPIGYISDGCATIE